jgi:hypothetical protein
MENKEQVEFIDASLEKDEITGFSFKDLIDGSALNIASIAKQLPFIMFMVFLAVVYITNRFHAEKIVRRLDTMNILVKELRAEQITTATELMNLSKPSKVQELINSKGLGLNEPLRPPYKILIK